MEESDASGVAIWDRTDAGLQCSLFQFTNLTGKRLIMLGCGLDYNEITLKIIKVERIKMKKLICIW